MLKNLYKLLSEGQNFDMFLLRSFPNGPSYHFVFSYLLLVELVYVRIG